MRQDSPLPDPPFALQKSPFPFLLRAEVDQALQSWEDGIYCCGLHPTLTLGLMSEHLCASCCRFVSRLFGQALPGMPAHGPTTGESGQGLCPWRSVVALLCIDSLLYKVGHQPCSHGVSG